MQGTEHGDGRGGPCGGHCQKRARPPPAQPYPGQMRRPGPVTHAGCGALCPTYDRGCYGCYGPKETANPASLDTWSGLEDRDLVRVYRTFNALRDPFREASEAHERD